MASEDDRASEPTVAGTDPTAPARTDSEAPSTADAQTIAAVQADGSTRAGGSAAPDGQAAPNRRSLVLMKVVTPFVVSLAMLVVLEVFLRLFMPLNVSDRLYWVPDGHVKARLEANQPVTNAEGNPVRTNRLGFRGKEWSWRPAPGTLRILALGGSATFCFQVSDDAHTWPALLEGLLQQRLHRPVEVLNLGLPGYDTSNSKVNYLFSGRALHPHVVVVYHTWNDLKFLIPIDQAQDGEMPRAALSGGEGTGRNPPTFTRAMRRLELVRRFDLVMLRMAAVERENRYTSLEVAGERAHRPVGERAWRWFEANFEDVVDFAKSDRVLPVLISQATLAKQPALDDQGIRRVIRNDLVGMTLPRLAENWEQATRLIAEVAHERGAIYVNGYDAVPPDLVHLEDHVHLLDPGAEQLARAIADALVEDPRFVEAVARLAISRPQ